MTTSEYERALRLSMAHNIRGDQANLANLSQHHGRALSRLMQSAQTDSHQSPRSCGRARRTEVVRFPREVVE